MCAALADRIKGGDEFYGSKNPRSESGIVIGWLAGIDAACEEWKFAQKLPYYLCNLAGLTILYIVPIFKPSHDAEGPVEL